MDYASRVRWTLTALTTRHAGPCHEQDQKIMKTLRRALRPVLVAVAAATLTACADTPPRRADMDYRSRPSPSAQSPNSAPASSDRRLTIQSGEGERLNLPWFIRDTQDFINRD
jgi:hypothetical protein